MTIIVKHHDPTDLVITVGYLEVTDDYKPLSLGSFTEEKVIWNKEASDKGDGINKTFNFEDLVFKSLKAPSKNQIVWGIEIEDHGTRHLNPVSENMMEDEFQDRGNYLAGFYVTVENITYRSFHHPFFDDGSKVRAELYGTEEAIVKDGTRSTIYSRVLGVISIGNFDNAKDLNPQQGYDSWAFINIFIDLANQGKMSHYDIFYEIDGWDEDHTRGPTHSYLYYIDVSFFLNTLDVYTDGNSRVVVLISSHGTKPPYTPSFWVCNTYVWLFWIFNHYPDSTLASYMKGMTEEGTKVWLWAHTCYSARMTKLKDSYYHKYKLLCFVYTKEAAVPCRYVEYDEFYMQIWAYGVYNVEIMFDDIRARFVGAHPGKDMERWDNLYGMFYLGRY